MSGFSGTAKYITNNHNAFTAALNDAPINICIDANPLSSYGGGIIDGSRCSTSINHAVVIVGYGSAETTVNGVKKLVDYYLVRNSWGTNWGEGGYFRLLRDMAKPNNNICGIFSVAKCSF